MILALKCENDRKFVRDSNSSLKCLPFQLSNVREIETIKYVFDIGLMQLFYTSQKILPVGEANPKLCMYTYLHALFLMHYEWL